MKLFRKGHYTIQDIIALLKADEYHDFMLTEDNLLLMNTEFEGYKMLFLEHLIDGQYSVSILSNFSNNSLIKNASKVFIEIDTEDNDLFEATMLYLNRNKDEEEISLESDRFLALFLEEIMNEETIHEAIKLEIKQDYEDLETDGRLHIYTFFILLRQRLKANKKLAVEVYEKALNRYLKEV